MIIRLLLLSSMITPVCAQTTYDANGKAIMRQTVEGTRLVDRDMNGKALRYWTREGGSVVVRSTNGKLVERIR
jgi:hypothetical protein